MSNLGDMALALAPPWLADDGPPVPVPIAQEGIAGRVVWLLGLVADLLVDKVQQGIQARLPLGGTTGPDGGNGGPYDDALAIIGADRVMARGLNEPALAYGQRLQRAFQTWQHAGQAATVMRQVLVYLGTQCKIAVVGATNTPLGFAVVFPPNADTSQEPSYSPIFWRWDVGPTGTENGGTPHPLTMALAWWRRWLVLWSVAPNAWATPAPVLGSGRLLGSGQCVGFTTPLPGVFKSLLPLLGQRKSADTWYQWIIVSFDANFANYSNVPPNDGTWGRWSKIATAVNPDGNTVPAYVAARGAQQRFVAGIATSGNQGPQNWPPSGAPAFPLY